MKRITFLCAILKVSLGLLLFPSLLLPQDKPPTWEVYFSRYGGCSDALLRNADAAWMVITKALWWKLQPIQ